MTENKTIVEGEYSEKEDAFIKQHYHEMTAADIAKTLNRNKRSVLNRIGNLGIKKTKEIPQDNKSRKKYIASLDDEERSKLFLSELKKSSTYKQLKAILTPEEIQYYEDKYAEFRIDPSIETLTSMEKDAWHEMVMAQIRIFRLMAQEKQHPDTSKAREIRDNQEVIQKCQESLNVQRKQRLKSNNDQAINFTSLIRELKDPKVRREVGYEAAMLKFMAEQFYNDHLSEDTSGNIIAGRIDAFDISKIFIDGVAPSGLSSEFS